MNLTEIDRQGQRKMDRQTSSSYYGLEGQTEGQSRDKGSKMDVQFLLKKYFEKRINKTCYSSNN